MNDTVLLMNGLLFIPCLLAGCFYSVCSKSIGSVKGVLGKQGEKLLNGDLSEDLLFIFRWV